MNYTPTYLGEIPLDEETLAHYGIKGMKWGRRKLKEAIGNLKTKRVKRKAKRLHNQSAKKRHKRYVNSHLVRDDLDGKIVRVGDEDNLKERYARRAIARDMAAPGNYYFDNKKNRDREIEEYGKKVDNMRKVDVSVNPKTWGQITTTHNGKTDTTDFRSLKKELKKQAWRIAKEGWDRERKKKRGN